MIFFRKKKPAPPPPPPKPKPMPKPVKKTGERVLTAEGWRRRSRGK